MRQYFRRDLADVKDLAVVRVFFADSEIWLYTQDVANYWYEIYSEFISIILKNFLNILASCR